MGSQCRAIWTGASAVQAFWCLMLLAASAWTAGANIEVNVLHLLRQALEDPNQFLISWDPSMKDPCSWFHVTCDSQNFVNRVDLHSGGLSGRLVPQLGQLSQLQYLELYNNRISGAIPQSFGNLTRLVSLDISGNDLTGKIPAELGNLSHLRALQLNTNNLTGAIPESLTGLDKLQMLDLSYNNLTGDIPMSGVFTKFPPQSFEGNPGLSYPALSLSPAPGPIMRAPSMAGTLILLNFYFCALRLFMAAAVLNLAVVL